MAHHSTPPAPAGRPPAWPIVLAILFVVLGLLGAAVALAYAGWSQESIIGLLLGLGTIAGTTLPLIGKILSDTHAQTETINEIHDNTNGKLRAAVEAAVTKALDERFPRG